MFQNVHFYMLHKTCVVCAFFKTLFVSNVPNTWPNILSTRNTCVTPLILTHTHTHGFMHTHTDNQARESMSKIKTALL